MPIFVIAAAKNAGTKKQEVIGYLIGREIGQPYGFTKNIEEATLYDEGTAQMARGVNAMGAMGGVANDRYVSVITIEV